MYRREMKNYVLSITRDLTSFLPARLRSAGGWGPWRLWYSSQRSRSIDSSSFSLRLRVGRTRRYTKNPTIGSIATSRMLTNIKQNECVRSKMSRVVKNTRKTIMIPKRIMPNWRVRRNGSSARNTSQGCVADWRYWTIIGDRILCMTSKTKSWTRWEVFSL